MPQPKSLPPLILRDPTGDELILQFWPDGVEQQIGAPVSATVRRIKGASNTETSIEAALLSRDQLREAIRWMADALGETPMLAAQPDFFRIPDADGDDYFIANHDGHVCWFCHQPIMVGAICERVFTDHAQKDVWAHDGCRPKPGQVVVLEVEG